MSRRALLFSFSILLLAACGADTTDPIRERAQPGGEAALQIAEPTDEAAITGSWGDVRFRAVAFQNGESARARFEADGLDDALYIHVEGRERGVLTWRGTEVDGFGALTGGEAAALEAIAEGPLADALAMVPLDVGCAPTEYEPALMQSLLFPWQLLMKYREADPLAVTREAADRSRCNYFPELTGQSTPAPNTTPDNLILGREDPFPGVFRYVPIDAEGTLSSPGEGGEMRTATQGLTACGFGPSGSGCRGSCGADCSANNCQERKVQRQVCGETVNLTVFTCGMHQGCIDHDICYDECSRDSLFWADDFVCHRDCDVEAVRDHGACNATAWARGFGPHTHVADFYYHDRCGQTPCIDEALEEEGRRRVRTNGDPHLMTADGLAYDFQSMGEFIAVEATRGEPFAVQVRQLPTGLDRCPGSVSYNVGMATEIAGQTVALYADRQPALTIDGIPATIPQRALPLGEGAIIAETDSGWRLIWPSGEQVEVRRSAAHFNLFIDLPEDRKGDYRGLLGTFNDDSADDIALRDGMVLDRPVAWDYLHGAYAESWRVSPEESLFTYVGGETYDGLNVSDHPNRPPTAFLTNQQLEEARTICADEGVETPINMQNCIVDVACTGNVGYAKDHATLPEPEEALEVVEPVFVGDWNVQGEPNNGRWVPEPDGRGVVQESNGNPTFYVSPNAYIDRTLRGTLEVNAGDDDIIGFVFGYQSPVAARGDDPELYEMFVLSWKANAQSGSAEGFTLAHVDGTVTSADYNPMFWQHTDGSTYRVLATAHGGELGWQRNVAHDFALTYTADRLVIAVDGQVIFDLTPAEAGVAFEAGRFGFYNYSQSGVRYADFSARPPQGDLITDSFELADFSDVSDLSILEDAGVVDGRLQMTDSERSRAAQVWHRGKPKVADGFETTFRFRISDPVPYGSDDGGEGLALVIQNDERGRWATGPSGVGLGYRNIARSLALEFDVRRDGDDPDANHVSLQSRGADPNSSRHEYSLASTSSGLPRFLDGGTHTVRVTYDGTSQQMQVFLDGGATPLIDQNVDLETLLGLRNGQAYVGFTASTGAATATHEVLAWEWSTP